MVGSDAVIITLITGVLGLAGVLYRKSTQAENKAASAEQTAATAQLISSETADKSLKTTEFQAVTKAYESMIEINRSEIVRLHDTMEIVRKDRDECRMDIAKLSAKVIVLEARMSRAEGNAV